MIFLLQSEGQARGRRSEARKNAGWHDTKTQYLDILAEFRRTWSYFSILRSLTESRELGGHADQGRLVALGARLVSSWRDAFAHLDGKIVKWRWGQSRHTRRCPRPEGSVGNDTEKQKYNSLRFWAVSPQG